MIEGRAPKRIECLAPKMIECLAPKMIECAEPWKEAVNIYEIYFLVHLPPPPLPKVNIKETYEKS